MTMFVLPFCNYIFLSRLRNVKNKLSNASEAFGLAKRTPMAYIMDELGIEPDLKYL